METTEYQQGMAAAIQLAIDKLNDSDRRTWIHAADKNWAVSLLKELKNEQSL